MHGETTAYGSEGVAANKGCSHGPVGRLPCVNSSAELNRPQAGGYSICEIALGPQMLRES